MSQSRNSRAKRDGVPVTAEHHQAVTDALRSVGEDPASLNPADLALAAEIHAREGVAPGEAYAIAVVNSLINGGYMDREHCEAADKLFAYQGSLAPPKSPEEAVMFYWNEYYPYSPENEDRYEAVVAVVHKQGGFTINEAMMAFWPATPATQNVKERVATWLRTELAKLRKAYRLGEHPVRRQKALSKLIISDIVITMLESGGRSAPGKNLLHLLEELLDIDRHRATLAQSAIYSDAFIEAATLEGQALIESRIYSARELAKLVGVRPATIIAWRKLPRYRFYIDWEKGVFDGSPAVL
jgi:hypothetical protein